MPRHIVLKIGIAALGLLALASCGQGSDGISDVLGANPISDARDVVHRSTNHGWTSTDAGRLESTLEELGLESAQVECIKDYVLDTWSPSEWMQTTENDPDVIEMVAKCA